MPAPSVDIRRSPHKLARMTLRRLLALSLLPLLAACATDPNKDLGTPEEDYKKAKGMIGEGAFSTANMFLEKYSTHHPYSQYTVQAEILRAYAAYMNREFILSDTLCSEFVRRHPRHPDIAYVKYLGAMSHYKQIVPPDRDQAETIAAIDAFKVLIADHPDSEYAREGRQRLGRLNEQLAEHELAIARYYFEARRYVAAANRLQTVVEKYQQTPSIEESLYLLAATYTALGMGERAHEAALLLRHNYPNSDWSRKSETL